MNKAFVEDAKSSLLFWLLAIGFVAILPFWALYKLVKHIIDKSRNYYDEETISEYEIDPLGITKTKETNIKYFMGINGVKKRKVIEYDCLAKPLEGKNEYVEAFINGEYVNINHRKMRKEKR